MTLASFGSAFPVHFAVSVAANFLSAAENGASKKTQMVLDASASLKPRRGAASSFAEARKPQSLLMR